MQERLRRLPAVEKVLQSSAAARALEQFPRPRVAEAVRGILQEKRRRLRSGSEVELSVSAEEILRELRRRESPPLMAVINASGVVVHTNLGRAPLSARALEQVQLVAGGYCNLEFDLEVGKRGKRTRLLRDILCELTGAEEALVVNNNAAAVYLALRQLAAGREALVSRGELVEIGGSFRMPDVMAAAGVKLVEVGTTNKTRLDDYRRAIGPQTALLMKIHRSNFELVGFTQEAAVPELVSLARQHRLPLLVDMGWGSVLENWPAKLGPAHHPRRLLEAGADVVCFSADKILGGPQAGILLGRSDLIKAMAADPMARALRVGKLTLASLWATLQSYREGKAIEEIPVARMLLGPAEELLLRARSLRRMLKRLAPDARYRVVESSGRVGGGALPRCELDGWAVEVEADGLSAGRLAARLRRGHPPVVARIRRERLLLDVRTVFPAQLKTLAEAVAAALLAERENG